MTFYGRTRPAMSVVLKLRGLLETESIVPASVFHLVIIVYPTAADVLPLFSDAS